MRINGYEFDYITDEFAKESLEIFEEVSTDPKIIKHAGELKHFLKDNPDMIPLTKKIIKLYCYNWPRGTADGMDYNEKIIRGCYEKYGKKYWSKSQTENLISIALFVLFGMDPVY